MSHSAAVWPPLADMLGAAGYRNHGPLPPVYPRTAFMTGSRLSPRLAALGAHPPSGSSPRDLLHHTTDTPLIISRMCFPNGCGCLNIPYHGGSGSVQQRCCGGSAPQQRCFVAAALRGPLGYKKCVAFSHCIRPINPERGMTMSRQRITAVGESAALLLPKDVLDQLGIAIGDEVELSLVDRTLILQPLDEADRARKLEAVTKTVFERRQSAYTRLAQGAE